MFPSHYSKKMETYRSSASQKNVNATPLKWYNVFKKIGPRFFGYIDRKCSAINSG